MPASNTSTLDNENRVLIPIIYSGLFHFRRVRTGSALQISSKSFYKSFPTAGCLTMIFFQFKKSTMQRDTKYNHLTAGPVVCYNILNGDSR